MIILAIDLGKFNSVSCRFDDQTQETSYERFQTGRKMLAGILEEQEPQLVVIEACTLSGWVVGLCRALQVEVIVANVAEDAWKWKQVKRKTDRDDALRLAKLAALGQITAVYTPRPAVRQWCTLIKHRKALVKGMANYVDMHRIKKPKRGPKKPPRGARLGEMVCSGHLLRCAGLAESAGIAATGERRFAGWETDHARADRDQADPRR